MSIKPGSTFLDTEDPPHLWIVVAGPDNGGKVIIANLTSIKGRDDRTTICQPGEHPFIVRESAIAYKYAMHVDLAVVQKAVANGGFIIREDCTKKLLEKVAEGLLRSDSTPLAVQNAYVAILRA